MRTPEYPASEVRFLASEAGNWTMVAASLAAFAGALWWARRRPERRRALGVGVGAAVALTGFTALSVQRGWWRGGLLELPLASEAAMFLPLTAAFYTFWIGGYHRLAQRTGHPWLTGVAMTLPVAPLVGAVEPWEMRRGYFAMGHGYRVAYNVAISPLVMGLPLAAFQALQARARRPQRTPALQPHAPAARAEEAIRIRVAPSPPPRLTYSPRASGYERQLLPKIKRALRLENM